MHTGTTRLEITIILILYFKLLAGYVTPYDHRYVNLATIALNILANCP